MRHKSERLLHLREKGGGKKERKKVFYQLLVIGQTHVEVQSLTLVYISITKIRQKRG